MAGGASSPAERAARHTAMGQLTWFVVAAFAGAWFVGGVAYVVLDLGEVGLGIGVLMVAVAALVATYRDERSLRPMLRQIARWRVGVRWYVTALVVPAVMVGTAVALAPRFGGEGVGIDAPGLAAVLTLPLYVLLLGGPEELGWRGYALPRLQARFTALPATLILGAIWMAWHVPVLLVPAALFDAVPVVPYLVIGVASAVVYTWLYNSTSGSILLAMLLHGAGNLALLWMPRSTMTWGLLAGAWVVAAVVVVAAYGPTDLARTPRHRVHRRGADLPALLEREQPRAARMKAGAR